MTFILSLGNADQVIQISDRRLTGDGKIVDDDSNKATCLVCQNGRFAIGYTGLAVSGSFKTQDWLLDALFNCAPPDYAIYEMVERFAIRASQDFSRIPALKALPPAQKRLSVMFTGYVTHRARPLVGNLIVTNFQDFLTGSDYPEAKKDFWIISELEKDEESPEITLIQRIGAWRAMKSDDEEGLRNLLRQRRSQEALINKAVHMIRQIADRSVAGGTVGKNLIATIISSNTNTPCVSIVKSNTAKNVITYADTLLLLGPEDRIGIKEDKLIIVDSPNDNKSENLGYKERNKIRKKRTRHKHHN